MVGLVVLVWSAMRSPLVQTQIANRLTATLSQMLNTEVSVKKARYYIAQGLTLQDVLIKCPNGDTLAFVPQFSAYLKSININEKRIGIQRAYMRGARANIVKTDSTCNFSFIADAFSRDDTAKGKWSIELNEITVVQTSFNFSNGNGTQHFSDLNIDLSDFSVNGDSISARLETFSIGHDGTALVDDMQMSFRLHNGNIDIDGLTLSARNSSARFGHIFLETGSKAKLSYTAEISELRLFPTDFAQLVPQLAGKTGFISLSGKIDGTGKRIRGKKIIANLCDSTSVQCDFSAKNIDNADSLQYKLTISELKTTSNDLLTLLDDYTETDTASMAKYATTLGKVHFNGYVEGSQTDVYAEGHLKTNVGNLYMETSMAKADDKAFNIDSYLKSSPILIGQFIGNDARLRIDLKANGTIGKADATSLAIEGSVSDIAYTGHKIDSVVINGLLEKDKFSGRLCSFDQNLRFDFDGLVDVRDSATFDFQSYVYYANLYALGLSENTDANLSFNMNANFRNTDINLAEGRIDLSDIYYFSDSSYFATDSVSITSVNDEGWKDIHLQSEFISAEVNGDFSFTEVADVVSGYARHLLTGAGMVRPNGENTLNLKIVADYPFPLTEKFAPWLTLSSGTSVEGSFSNADSIRLTLHSDNIVAKSIELKNVSTDIHSSGDSLIATMASDYLYFAGYETMKGLQATSSLKDGTARLNTNWDNRLGHGRNSGDINALVHLGDPRQTTVSVLQSSITILDTLVAINPASIAIGDTSVVFSHINIDNGSSRVMVDGVLSDNPNDSLSVSVDNLKLDFLSNMFNLQTRFAGLVSANSSLKDLKGEKRIVGNLKVDDFAINRQRFGNVEAHTAWDMEERQLLVSGAMSDKNDSRTSFSGFVNPSLSYMDIDAEASHQDVQFLKLFLSNVFSEMDGTFSGKMHLDGDLKSPNWYGKMGLENAHLTLKPTKATYLVSDTLEFSGNQILFNNVKGTDTESGKLVLNGNIWHRNMKDFNINLSIDCDNIIGLNTRSSDSPLWYGKTYCSGIVNVNGTTHHTIDVGISATTMPKSMFYITMAGRNDLSENDFITFIKSTDINNINEIKKAKQEQELVAAPSVLNLDLNLKVTPDAEIQIVFDPTIGDALRSSGSADLSIRLNDGKFSIYGTYLISSGDFTFTLQNVISKKLDLQSGSYVTWTGEPLGATVNIDAAYKLRKVPVYSLTLNEDDREKKVPVNCHLIMNNKLVSPDISFSVDVPANTTSVEEIEQLNSLPKDDLNQQVIYLLLLNKFYPLTNVASGDASSSAASVSASTASEIISNQLSKWISQVSTNFDLGVAYRPETEISSEEYELALSTTLWDDRIVVNSNFDVNSQDKATGNGTSQYTTDFSVELKLNKKGNVRLKAFQKVNEDLIYDDAPYTRGLGIFFTEDFNEFNELWRRWFRRKEAKKPEDEDKNQ